MLNEKGREIKSAFEKQYGKKKGDEVFYASENKGNFKNVKGGITLKSKVMKHKPTY